MSPFVVAADDRVDDFLELDLSALPEGEISGRDDQTQKPRRLAFRVGGAPMVERNMMVMVRSCEAALRNMVEIGGGLIVIILEEAMLMRINAPA